MIKNSCDDIYTVLEKEIINLQIKPGQALSESQLCERFSVSRTPIRSVLQRLQEKELVQIKPYKGTFVTLLDYEIVSQIIYQRVAVESMVLRDFVKSCDQLDVERIRHAVRNMEIIVESDSFKETFNTETFYTADSAIHEIWFHGTRNSYLWECFQRYQANYTRFRILDILEAQNTKDVLIEHKELLRIVEEKDFSAIEDLIRKHLYGGMRRLGNSIFTEFKDYFNNMENNSI